MKIKILLLLVPLLLLASCATDESAAIKKATSYSESGDVFYNCTLQAEMKVAVKKGTISVSNQININASCQDDKYVRLDLRYLGSTTTYYYDFSQSDKTYIYSKSDDKFNREEVKSYENNPASAGEFIYDLTLSKYVNENLKTGSKEDRGYSFKDCDYSYDAVSIIPYMSDVEVDIEDIDFKMYNGIYASSKASGKASNSDYKDMDVELNIHLIDTEKTSITLPEV